MKLKFYLHEVKLNDSIKQNVIHDILRYLLLEINLIINKHQIKDARNKNDFMKFCCKHSCARYITL